MVAGTDILSIVDRIDRLSNRMEAAEVARLHSILDQSFKALEAELRRTYPELQSIGGLVAAQRKTLVLEKLGRALDLIDPDQTDAYRGQFRDLMTLSNDLGGSLSEQLLTAYGETNLEPFTGINIEAISNLASEGVKRLYRYSDDFKEKTTALIGMGLIQGWGAGRLIPEMRRQLGLTKGKAETLVRTEVMGALNQAAISRYEDNGIEYSQWWNSPSEGLCGRCAVRNGRVYRNKDIIYPVHPRCLPGDVVVSSPSIKAGTSRKYTGQVVCIETTSGKKLTATPNHPVLTDKGWVALNLVNEGDYVFSSFNAEDAVASVSPDDYQSPSRISEVVSAFRKSSRVTSVGMKVSPVDFHGDGEGSDVCVISSDRLLGDNIQPHAAQPFNHSPFVGRLVGTRSLLAQSLSAFSLPTKGLPSMKVPRSFSVPLPLFRSLALPLDSLCLGCRADMHSGIGQDAPNRSPGDTVPLGDRLLGNPANVVADYSIPDSRMTLSEALPGLSVQERLSLGGRSPEPSLLDRGPNSVGIDSDSLSSSLDGLAGKVYRDRVIKKTVIDSFSGHVYNLETKTGWYFANDILTHNCRCYLSPWKPEWQAAGLTDDSFAEQYRQQGFAQLEANGLKPDYSPSGFEKNAGLTAAPKAAWSPGDKPLAPAPAASPEPAPPAAPKRPRKPREFPTKAQLGKLEVIRPLGGSTGAELVRDPKLDKLFVRKHGSSAAHLRDEFAADAIYRAMGANVPKAKLYETDQGPVKLAEFVQGRPLSDLTLSEKQSVHKQLQDGFAADALLGNWDVIGLSQDNILVDADGKPWRIDNGGSLRFRAQGAPKRGDQWNDYPTELWSLRDTQVNTQAAEVFGGLTHFDMVKQIEQLQGDRKALLKATPKDLKATVERRLDEMARVAAVSRTLEQDQWKEDYISRFTKHSLGLRNAGIVGKLPQRLDLAQNNQVYDQDRKLFDNLRGQGSIVADVERYINGNGGSYNAIAGWAGQQAGSSWSNASQTLKWELAQSRNVPLDRYFWRNGTDGAKQSWEQGMKMIGADTYRESLAAFHAWNYELLQAVEMPNNDRKNNIFRAVRTENRYVMDTINKLSPGDRGVVIPRGAAESTSMFTKVSVYGSEVTVQNIPHHRVLGMYLQSRRSSGGSMFLGDGENELVALLEGIEMDYLKPKSWRNAKPNYSP